MKYIFTLSFLALLTFPTLAQVNSTAFSQSMDSYQTISGTVVDAPNQDDVFHPNLPIGFNFVYNGSITNKFGVCTNGFIAMDSLMHNSFWQLNANCTNQVSVLRADMINSNTGGTLEYVTVGTAPNRVCIIQWKDYGMYANAFCHLNAQIRLFETSNCIQLYYGSNELAGNIGKDFFVGLTGNTVADYNLRETNTNWVNSSVSQTFPGGAMLLNPLVNLPSGLVFSFGSCPPAGIQFSYISGNVFNDVNGNGIREAGENAMPNVLIHEVTQNTFASTDTAGNYSLFFIDSNLTYSVTALPLMYWNITSNPATYTVTPISQNTNNIDFGLHPTPNIHDVTITTLAGNVPWPTANVNFYTTFHNNGTVIEPGDSIFLVKDSHFSFNFSNPAPAYISGDSIIWVYSNLLVNEFRNITMQLHADSTITAGDTLHSFWTIKPIASDVAPGNNYYAKHQLCNAAFDPNSKEVSPDGNIINSQELAYTIHFQNTGTAPALNVFLHDTLDTNLDVSTFKILANSHPMTYTISGNGNLTFTFANINLPDSNANEPASHGAVSYSIKPKQGLSAGTQIENTASILFDFNAPIITNTTVNIIIENMPNGFIDFENEDNSLLVYPNPTADKISIQSDNSLKGAIVLINDMTGKIILKQVGENDKQIDIQVSSLPKGIYLLEVQNGKSSTKRRITKK